MRSELFCYITQHIVVIPYRRFGTLTCPIFKDKKTFLTPSWILKAWLWDRWVF